MSKWSRTTAELNRERFWRTAPADPIALAKKAGVPHYGRPLGRSLMPQSPMPIGEHAGKIMAEVPADYLAWVHAQPWSQTWPQWTPVADYLARHPLTLENTGDWPAQILFLSPVITCVPDATWRHPNCTRLTCLRDHDDKLHAFAVGALGLLRKWHRPADKSSQSPSPAHYRLTHHQRHLAESLGAFPLAPGLKERTQHFTRLRETGQTQCTKHCYPTQGEADLTARERMKSRRNRPLTLRTYECPQCGFWHLTSKPFNP